MNAVTKIEAPFAPSPQQLDFYTWVDTGRGSLVLEAVAGSGKTETLARGVIMMKGTVEILMFNKSAAVEFKSRLQKVGADRQGVFVSTCHSVGFNIFRRSFPGVEVNEKKVANILEGMAERDPEINAEALAPFVTKLVDLGKQMLAGVDWQVSNIAAWLKLAQKFGCDQDLPECYPIEEAIALVQRVFDASGKMCTKIIDYSDMIWAPIAYKCRFFGNDWVVGDEWQDSNPARRRLAKLLMKPNGRFVAAGDSRQAIYQFTGANSDSLDITVRDLDCARLPLSVTYRCPKAVVEYARTWVSHITAHETAPDGLVRRMQVTRATSGKMDPWYRAETPGPTDAILCRYNAPLIKTAYGLLGAGIACKVEGREIGKSLMQLVRRWKVKTLEALQNKLEGWLAKEVEKAVAAKSETREQASRDKYDCLMVFITKCQAAQKYTVIALTQEIEELFGDDVKGVLTLASGHKAKGREWGRVWYLETSVKKREMTPEEEVAEDNVKYVICTRAKSELVLIGESLQ